jgi:3-oxoacyl-[acyl-carrier protein] reductase
MNILITGASRGVGYAICEVLLKQGHTIYAISRTHTDELEILEKRFNETFFFKSVDLSNSQNIQNEVFKTFVNNTISLDGFVNNAAMAYDDIITNLNLEKLETMFKTNVYSPMLITKYAIRNMLFNKKSGSIIHISSISAHTGYKGLAMYASSKGAIEAFSKNTAREWGEMGIRSNVVVPGFMETAMSASLSEQQKDRIYKRTSLKKATSVESVAETVAFLLSDKAISITGQNIHNDSGTI